MSRIQCKIRPLNIVCSLGALCFLIFSLFLVQLQGQLPELTGSTVMPRTPHVSYEPLPTVNIELIPGTAAEFDAALRSIADADSVASLQTIAPYSLMVKNNTPERLIAVTVRFYLTDQGGRTVWHQMTVGTTSNRLSGMIAPSEFALVTPETGLNTVVRPALSMNIPDALALNSRLAKHADLYSRQAQVRIVLDSVIFEDGGVVGPDKGRMLEMLNAWAAAEDTVTDHVLARHGSDVDAYLASATVIPVHAAASLDLEDHLAKHHRQFAADLLRQRKIFKSEDEFFAYLQTRRFSRIPTLKRRSK